MTLINHLPSVVIATQNVSVGPRPTRPSQTDNLGVKQFINKNRYLSEQAIMRVLKK
jgi:hypothetical protein